MTFDLETAARAAAPLFLSLVAPLAAAQGKQYTITNLSTPLPGPHFAGAALSNTGYVTAWQIPSQGPLDSIGYRWSPERIVRPTPPIPEETLKTVTADAVNDEGTFVGAFGDTPNFWTRGYRWKEGRTDELFTPLGFRAYPVAINAAGTIVGYAGDQPGGTPGAVMWTPDLVPSFVANLQRPTDVNDAGQIVGYRTTTSGVPGAFLWDSGSLVPIPPLPPATPGDVIPLGLNEHAVVVGFVTVGGVERAFRWTQAGGTTQLPDLGITHFPPDAGAHDLNDDGWIVGYVPGNTGRTDVLWTPAGTPIELETLVPDVGPGLPWVKLFEMVSINDAGQIAGTAVWHADVQPRTVLLTPADLDASDLAPGQAGTLNTLEVDGAEPGRLVFLAADLDDFTERGYSTLPDCEPLGLSMRTARLVAVAAADATGHASFAWTVPAHLAGRSLRLQAWQPGVCELSRVVRVSL